MRAEGNGTPVPAEPGVFACDPWGIIGDFEHQTEGHRLTHVLRTLEASAKIPVLRVEREVAVEVAGRGWSLDLC